MSKVAGWNKFPFDNRGKKPYYWSMSNRTAKLDTCICSGKSLDRMLRPAVLVILYAQKHGLHGYAIEKQLRIFKFFQHKLPDYTGLYRLLKQMETEGILASSKTDSFTGPAKRIYQLTNRGKKCLNRWLISLNEYQQMLDDLLMHARQTLETES